MPFDDAQRQLQTLLQTQTMPDWLRGAITVLSNNATLIPAPEQDDIEAPSIFIYPH